MKGINTLGLRRRCLLFHSRDGVSHFTFQELARKRNHHADSFPLTPLGNDSFYIAVQS
ncbi:hypothetical protein [Sphaerochaeta halotolerans]|uniref:hypothetical protein n=1 Tax=Sphaerochaeta halotolerans TaxID=2293840 RepID=UPI00136DF443|nr:hypothetical protein [Sphaerochaeta halotolerans]MXI85895.1 hypothetical protein [Sphaerochaeta halotolerans]